MFGAWGLWLLRPVVVVVAVVDVLVVLAVGLPLPTLFHHLKIQATNHFPHHHPLHLRHLLSLLSLFVIWIGENVGSSSSVFVCVVSSSFSLLYDALEISLQRTQNPNQ